MSGAATPTAAEAPALDRLDERDVEPRTPMKRLGSTRKLAAFNNIRIQLSEQTRVLEARAEAAAGVAGELADYCRRRADLEHEYARALDKLARAAHQRHKDQKHKREQWALTGAFACWQAALESTRSLSRDHAALADLYAGPLAARLQRAADDALRLHRKCRDIVAERHEEVGVALAEAGAAGKAHAAAAAEWRAAALKLRHAADQRARLAAADPPRQKKLKALDKELEKRRARHSAARGRALRARADYALSLEAANATLQRYYLDDIADIMLCTEVGFEAVVGRCVRTAGAGEARRAAAAGAAAAALLAAADALDALADRQRVLDAHAQAFALPRPLPYQGATPENQDAEMRGLVEGAGAEEDAESRGAAAELAARLAQLEAGARQLRAECRESAKTLDAAEAELVRQMEGADAHWDVSGLFGPDAPGGGALAPLPDDADAPRRDQEDYYLAGRRPPAPRPLRRAAGPPPAARADVVRARHRGVRHAAPGRVPRVGLAGGDAGSARRLRARRGPARARARRLRHQLGVRAAEDVPARGAAAAAAAAAAGGAAARGGAAGRGGVRAAAARHAGRAAAARRAGAALPVRLPGAPHRVQRAQHDGRLEPGHLPGAHAAGGVGRGRRAGHGAEPAQRAGQAHHPAPRGDLPAAHRAARALRAHVAGRRGAGGGGRAGRARRPLALRRRRRHQRGRRERRVAGLQLGRHQQLQVGQRRAPRVRRRRRRRRTDVWRRARLTWCWTCRRGPRPPPRPRPPRPPPTPRPPPPPPTQPPPPSPRPPRNPPMHQVLRTMRPIPFCTTGTRSRNDPMPNARTGRRGRAARRRQRRRRRARRAAPCPRATRRAWPPSSPTSRSPAARSSPRWPPSPRCCAAPRRTRTTRRSTRPPPGPRRRRCRRGPTPTPASAALDDVFRIDRSISRVTVRGDRICAPI